MRAILYFSTIFLTLGSALTLAEGKCVKYLSLNPIYSSSWVEPFYESGVMEGIVDFNAALAKRTELLEDLKQTNILLATLRENPPAYESEYKEYIESVFSAVEEKENIIRFLSLLRETEEMTEKFFVFKFVFDAHKTIASRVKVKNLCLNEAEFINLVTIEARTRAASAANKLLQPTANPPAE